MNSTTAPKQEQTDSFAGGWALTEDTSKPHYWKKPVLLVRHNATAQQSLCGIQLFTDEKNTPLATNSETKDQCKRCKKSLIILKSYEEIKQ